MFFYIIAALVLVILLSHSWSDLNRFRIFMGFIAMLSLLRWETQGDFVHYYMIAQNLYSLGNHYHLSDLLIKFVQYTGSPYLIFVVFGGLTYFFIYKGISACCKDYLVAGAAYVALLLISSWSEIRQSLAIAVVCFSLQYVFKKQLLLYLCGVCIAGLIHSSAFVSLIFYPLLNLPLKYAAGTLAAAMIGGIWLSATDVIGNLFPEYSYYANNLENFSSGGKYLRFAVLLWPTMVLILDRQRKEHLIFYLLLYGGLLLPFFINFHLGMRLYYYFDILLIYLVSTVMHKRGLVLHSGFYLCSFLYFLCYVYAGKHFYQLYLLID